MKNLFVTLFVALAFLPASEAQDTTIIYRSTGTDTVVNRHQETSRYNYVSRKRTRIIRERWGLLDLGISFMDPRENYSLANGIDPFEQRLIKSTNVNIHFLRARLQGRNGNLGLNFGPSLEIFKYFFENPIGLQSNQPEVTIDYFDGENYDKNRLTATYLTFPLMLSYQSNPRRPDNTFHIAFGIDAGLLLGANYKTRLSGEKKNTKIKDNYNLSQWRADLRVEFGIGPVQLYGAMGLNDLFETDQNGGYEITPFSFGFILLPF
ncbi:MAG: PorT family protein [Saprospiraceae bacterium]|nr:PorT family protein [Saprospiraceae bacterium]